MTETEGRTYWDDLELHDGGSRIDDIWLSHPVVRAAVNRRVSGDESVWPTQWLARELRGELPIRSSVVIGCGTGAFERDVVRQNIVTHVYGLDVAEAPIARAKELAAAEGLRDRISYVRTDAAQWLDERPETFDAVFFHASLHHLDPDVILPVVRRSLRPGGLLFFDEYVGPSRAQWTLARLLVANLAYRALPHALVRPHLVRAPVNHDDPTEAMASDRILPAVRRHFTVVAERPYGGELLWVIYPNLHRPPAVPAATLERGIRRILGFERVLSRLGALPYFAVVVARKDDQSPQRPEL